MEEDHQAGETCHWSIVRMKASDWSTIRMEASDWSIVRCQASDWSIPTKCVEKCPLKPVWRPTITVGVTLHCHVVTNN